MNGLLMQPETVSRSFVFNKVALALHFYWWLAGAVAGPFVLPRHFFGHNESASQNGIFRSVQFSSVLHSVRLPLTAGSS